MTTALSPVDVRQTTLPLLAAGVATVVFGTYGWLTRSPNTELYLGTVVLLGSLLHAHRRSIPTSLGMGLVVVAILHLAGGLVQVGDDVLYNTTAGGELLRYDHLVHSLASFVGTLTCWRMFRGSWNGSSAVWLLAGLGLGAINETIEFVSTMLNSSSHVGGYTNTGWDLVCNLLGSLTATAVIAARR